LNADKFGTGSVIVMLVFIILDQTIDWFRAIAFE